MSTKSANRPQRRRRVPRAPTSSDCSTAASACQTWTPRLRSITRGSGSRSSLTSIRNAPYLHEALDLPFSELRYVLLGIPGAPGNQVELLEYRGLERMPASARPCDPGSGHVCLQVRDAAAAFARMEALGYRARSAGVVDIDSGVNAGGRLAYVADPDGFWVELLERPA